jgi:hypothetical protein
LVGSGQELEAVMKSMHNRWSEEHPTRPVGALEAKYIQFGLHLDQEIQRLDIRFSLLSLDPATQLYVPGEGLVDALT